jgi:5-methyltetrahydrofolate--homocysteine methyltransferase
LADRITIFDSAMGTALIAAGVLPAGESSELANIDAPEAVLEIHRRNIEAGCDVITSNTFSAHIPEGTGENDPKAAEEALRAGVRLARKAADMAMEEGGRHVLVALDIGPTGGIIGLTNTLTHDDAMEMFARAAGVGASEGADLILIETISDLAEAVDAVVASKAETDLPVICSMTFGESGRTFMGVSLEDFVEAALEAGADAVGVNCTLGPAEIFPIAEALVELVGRTGKDIPVLVQPNAGQPQFNGTEVCYDMTPEVFVDRMCAMTEAGVRMVGGCCGTTPDMIAALRERLR